MRHIWILRTFPLDLGFRWKPTGKGGTELFQRECSVFLSTPPFHFTLPSLDAWLLVSSCELVSKFRGDVPAPNLESWAMAWLAGPPCLWSPVYEIWGLNTALSQEVENGDRNQPQKKLRTSRFMRKLKTITLQRIMYPWHPICQDWKTQFNSEELADA